MQTSPLSRRHFLRSAGAASLAFMGLHRLVSASGGATALLQEADGRQGGPGFGPLVRDPRRLLDLPEGFSYRVLSRLGQVMDDGFLVPGAPDGMAAFPHPSGKTIVVRNHEIHSTRMPARWGPFGADLSRMDRIDPEMIFDRGQRAPCMGGTTTFVYDTRTSTLERQFLSLAGAERNCAGGATPWNSWITCEEIDARAGEEDYYAQHHGYAFEVPATMEMRLAPPRPILPMGRLFREAVAVDPNTSVVYQTEDQPDGVLYRFVPDKPGDLHAGGRQQALVIRGARGAGGEGLDTRNWEDSGQIPVGASFEVAWTDLEDIQSPNNDLRHRAFAGGAARFARAEGAVWTHDSVYFVCTNGGRAKKGQIWRYTPSAFEGTAREDESPGRLELFIEPNDASQVNMPDNCCAAPWGDLILCEDNYGSDESYLVGCTPSGGLYKVARNAKDKSEFAGACFSPDGTTLFVNMQSLHLTLAIRGPWRG